MAPFRPNVAALREFRQLFGELADAGQVPWVWLRTRAVAAGRLEILQGDLFDISSIPLREELMRQHVDLLAQYDMDHLDVAQICSTNRAVSKAIARGLYDQGAAGIFYRSNYDGHRCLALFEDRARLVDAGATIPLSRKPRLRALRQVATEFGLKLAKPE